MTKLIGMQWARLWHLLFAIFSCGITTVIGLGITITIILYDKMYLPFLDILVCSKSNVVTSFYRKPTHTGLLTNLCSFIPFKYKNGFTKTLLDSCYKINDTWKIFNNDLENLSKILNKKQFPTRDISKVSKQYLNFFSFFFFSFLFFFFRIKVI